MKTFPNSYYKLLCVGYDHYCSLFSYENGKSFQPICPSLKFVFHFFTS